MERPIKDSRSQTNEQKFYRCYFRKRSTHEYRKNYSSFSSQTRIGGGLRPYQNRWTIWLCIPSSLWYWKLCQYSSERRRGMWVPVRQTTLRERETPFGGWYIRDTGGTLVETSVSLCLTPAGRELARSVGSGPWYGLTFSVESEESG